jgi:hypothetical protein
MYKKFPKKFQNLTTAGNGFPTYRRRSPENGGRVVYINRGNQVHQIDNRWTPVFATLPTFYRDMNERVQKKEKEGRRGLILHPIQLWLSLLVIRPGTRDDPK